MSDQKGDKGYQLDPDEQWRRGSRGEDVYTLGNALAGAIQPVYDYFLKKTGCDRCAAIATEKEVLEIFPEAIDACRGGPLKTCKDHQ